MCGPPAPPPLPPFPDPKSIKEQALKDAQRRAVLKTKTILTSGAGVVEDAILKKRTLLGG